MKRLYRLAKGFNMIGFLKIIYNFLIFPGFLFTAVVGLLSTWVDRKVAARVQWRVGPPFYQPFADALKLLGKEVIIPEGASVLTFMAAPPVGLAGAILVSTILWMVNLYPGISFVGDLIVVLYLLILPALSIIVGGFSSRNPLGILGASREMKLLLAYELPFIIAIFTPVAKSGTIVLGEIIKYQSVNGMFLGNISCIIAFIVALICVQAKLTYVPFDMPEAEQEIMGGAYIEYSGVLLLMFKLTKAMLLFTLPVLLITLFMGGIDVSSSAGIIYFILKYVGILVLIILIKNTNPRLRIDQAVRFFWGPVTILSVLGFVLTLIGW